MPRRPRTAQACERSLRKHLRPDLFRALCDPTRVALLGRLATASGPLTVTRAADCCGIHLSGVSRQLGMLRDAGIVQAEKQGREVLYRLDCRELVEVLRGLADAIEDCEAVCCKEEGT